MRSILASDYSTTLGQMIDLVIARDMARLSYQTDAYLRDSWQVARNCLAIDYFPVRQALHIRAIELVIADRGMSELRTPIEHTRDCVFA